jgi:C_GCAxxG_C_C family probable redox protein
MLRDRIYDYYINKDYNCAETALHAINDDYELDIPNEMFKLISGFGAGMGCGNACGALCACVAALGKLTITERAHTTENFKERCAGLVHRFSDELGETTCCELVKKYRKQDTRCLDTLLLTADVFDEYIKAIIK